MTAAHTSIFKPKRAVFAVLLILLPMAPSLLLAPLGLSAATGTFALGSIAGLIAGLLLGWRFALLVAAVVGLANFAAIPAAPYAAAAALVMGTTALLYGLTSRRGISGVVLMAPQSVAFTLAEPPTVLTHGSVLANAVVVGAVALVGGVWGAGVGGFLGRQHPRKAKPGVPQRAAVAFAVTIALVTGLAMAVVVAMQLQHGGAWLLLTLLIVIQPGVHQTWRKAIDRALGTVLGFGLALAVALVFRQPVVLLTFGLVFLAVGVYVYLDTKRPYWQFVTFLTPGIVLVEGAGANVIDTDVTRLWFTLIGVAIGLVVAGVFKWTGLESFSAKGVTGDI